MKAWGINLSQRFIGNYGLVPQSTKMKCLFPCLGGSLYNIDIITVNRLKVGGVVSPHLDC